MTSPATHRSPGFRLLRVAHGGVTAPLPGEYPDGAALRSTEQADSVLGVIFIHPGK